MVKPNSSKYGLRYLALSPKCTAFLGNRHLSTCAETQGAHVRVFEDVGEPLKKVREYGIYQSLLSRYPGHTVTMTYGWTGLLAFVKAGEASMRLDTQDQKMLSCVKYETSQSDVRSGNLNYFEHRPLQEGKASGGLRDFVCFARYDYQWRDKNFIVYSFSPDYTEEPAEYDHYFILYPKEADQIVDGRSTAARDLIVAASSYTNELHEGDVLVFDDGYWAKSTRLWKSVQASKWESVILDEKLKEALISDVAGFFDQEDDYKGFGVPWKRGIILHGLPGNGKTMTVKALMNHLAARDKPLPTLYVKSADGRKGSISDIRSIFKEARRKSPCLLVFEDLETLVTPTSRSFFLNELDGMESNDGIMMIGSTNYLEKLDAGITKRPSRFDRKYHFDLPAIPERVRYCEFWRSRLTDNKLIEFPPNLSQAIANLTDGFSFAYLQEAFISTLLSIVREERDHPGCCTNGADGSGSNDLEHLKLWQVMREQVEMIRNEVRGGKKSARDALEYVGPKQVSTAGFG